MSPLILLAKSLETSDKLITSSSHLQPFASRIDVRQNFGSLKEMSFVDVEAKLGLLDCVPLLVSVNRHAVSDTISHQEAIL